MPSNYTKGAVLFAAIYLLVFLLSTGFSSVRTAAASNPILAHSSVVSTPTAATSALGLWVLIVEILAVSAIALAEMRFQALSRVMRYLRERLKNMHPALMKIVGFLTFMGLDFLVFAHWGADWWLFFTINFTPVVILTGIYSDHFASLRGALPILIVFISFFVLWPLTLVLVHGNYIVLFLAEFAYIPLAYLASILLMRKPTQLKMNSVAFFFSISLPLAIGTLFTPLWAILLLAIFALYDFVAVFITKHMGFMAQKLLALSIPEAFMIGDIKWVKKRLSLLRKGQDASKAIPEARRPLIFGVGDAILPSISISSFVYAGLPAYALAAAIGCIIGVVFDLEVLRLKKKVLPALPLICMSVLAALAVASLL